MALGDFCHGLFQPWPAYRHDRRSYRFPHQRNSLAEQKDLHRVTCLGER